MHGNHTLAGSSPAHAGCPELQELTHTSEPPGDKAMRPTKHRAWPKGCAAVTRNRAEMKKPIPSLSLQQTMGRKISAGKNSHFVLRLEYPEMRAKEEERDGKRRGAGVSSVFLQHHVVQLGACHTRLVLHSLPSPVLPAQEALIPSGRQGAMCTAPLRNYSAGSLDTHVWTWLQAPPAQRAPEPNSRCTDGGDIKEGAQPEAKVTMSFVKEKHSFQTNKNSVLL